MHKTGNYNQITSLNRKGKPFERMGHKAFNLRVVFSNEFLVFSFPNYYKPTTKHYYGGWVAEVGVVSYLSPSHFVLPILEAFSSPETLKV